MHIKPSGFVAAGVLALVAAIILGFNGYTDLVASQGLGAHGLYFSDRNLWATFLSALMAGVMLVGGLASFCAAYVLRGRGRRGSSKTS